MACKRAGECLPNWFTVPDFMRFVLPGSSAQMDVGGTCIWIQLWNCTFPSNNSRQANLRALISLYFTIFSATFASCYVLRLVELLTEPVVLGSKFINFAIFELCSGYSILITNWLSHKLKGCLYFFSPVLAIMLLHFCAEFGLIARGLIKGLWFV